MVMSMQITGVKLSEIDQQALDNSGAKRPSKARLESLLGSVEDILKKS